jgi:hypothetical protein
MFFVRRTVLAPGFHHKSYGALLRLQWTLRELG